MKVLFAAFAHDPNDPNKASGADYQFFQALSREGFDLATCGPVDRQTAAVERLLRRFYRSTTKKRYVKFTLSRTVQAGAIVTKAARAFMPDVVFTIFPAAIVHYRGHAPCLIRLDTTFNGYQQDFPEFGDLALRVSMWQERRAFAKATTIVTHSDWAKRDLIENYQIPEDRIRCFPNPAALPDYVIPERIDPRETKELKRPWQLLLVGRNYHRKAVDVGITIVEALNAAGNSSHLTVVGLDGESTSHVTFAGIFRKNDPRELEMYTGFYSRAHLLVHPSRFDPSPIVTSEAAAFGTPTLTHDVGGLATSVRDGVSGIVLPKNSPPRAFVAAISNLLNNQDRYYELCASTRLRYDGELNWNVAGKRLAAIIKRAVPMSSPLEGHFA